VLLLGYGTTLLLEYGAGPDELLGYWIALLLLLGYGITLLLLGYGTRLDELLETG